MKLFLEMLLNRTEARTLMTTDPNPVVPNLHRNNLQLTLYNAHLNPLKIYRYNVDASVKYET